MDMVIYCCIIFNFILIFPYLYAKPIIQRGVIRREDKKAFDQHKSFQPDNILQSKKSSPSKYRKTFHIKSPLKPKKVKYSQRPRNKRKNQTTKKDYYHYATINQNYIPILKNLGLLFNNILGSDSNNNDNGSEDYTNPYKFERDDVTCECAHKRKLDSKTSDSHKKAVTITRTFSARPTTTSPTTTTSAYNFTNNNIGNFRRHKNISSLFPRNTISIRRNDYRFSQRGGPAYNGSIERHITGNFRNHERDARGRKFESHTENYIENTYSDTRDSANSNRSDDATRRPRKRFRNLSRTNTTNRPILTTNKTSGSPKRNVFKQKEKNKFKIRRNKTKNADLLSEPSSGIRRIKPFERSSTRETIESNEKEINEISFNATSIEQFPGRNDETTTENQEIRRTHEELITTITSLPTSENFEILNDRQKKNNDSTKFETKTEQPLKIQVNTLEKTKSYETNNSYENMFEITFNSTKIKHLPSQADDSTLEDQEIISNSKYLATTMPTPDPALINKLAMIYDKKIGKHEFKISRNKTITTELFTKPPKIKALTIPEKTNSYESYESIEDKSFETKFNTTYIKQLPNQKKNSTEFQNLPISYDALTTTMTISTPVEKFVMIYDGYSVARDVNNKNVLAKKSITV